MSSDDALQPATPQTCQEKTSKIAELCNSPLLCFIANMDRSSMLRVRELAPKLQGQTKLTILLHSPGGTIEDAYRMVLTLRRYVDTIDILVPVWAKSAATFFCLNANTVYMGPNAELGPLDPQILDTTGGARMVSALESFKALEQLGQYSREALDTLVHHLLSHTHMDIKNALAQAHPLFSAVVTPLFQQIDPYKLGEAGRYLSVGEEYALRAMRRWGYRHLDERDRKQIVNRLVWHYPTHSFVIDLLEAKEIGLEARLLDEERDQICQDIVNIQSETPDFVYLVLPKTQVDAEASDESEECKLKKDEGSEQSVK